MLHCANQPAVYFSQHKENDLQLFNRIMVWVGDFSDKYSRIYEHIWTDKTKTMESVVLHPGLLHSLLCYSQKETIRYNMDLVIEGYTELRVPSGGSSAI